MFDLEDMSGAIRCILWPSEFVTCGQLVELEACGVCIEPQNDLMRACGTCLREALEYGKLVRHRNGDSGIDELWGEPFKAFIMSIEDFYESRYVKIALTMRNTWSPT